MQECANQKVKLVLFAYWTFFTLPYFRRMAGIHRIVVEDRTMETIALERGHAIWIFWLKRNWLLIGCLAMRQFNSRSARYRRGANADQGKYIQFHHTLSDIGEYSAMDVVWTALSGKTTVQAGACKTSDVHNQGKGRSAWATFEHCRDKEGLVEIHAKGPYFSWPSCQREGDLLVFEQYRIFWWMLKERNWNE